MDQLVPLQEQSEQSQQTLPQTPEAIPVSAVREPMKVLLSWRSPARPFERKNREFYTTAGSILFLVCVILLFVKEFLFIMALIAMAFFYYIITSVEPEHVEHRITNKGIFSIDKLYEWAQLGRFWFETKLGQEVLMVENFMGLPPRLMIVLDEQKKETVQELLEKYVIMEKPELGQVEKMGLWLQKKVNIEKDGNLRPTQNGHPSQTPQTKA